MLAAEINGFLALIKCHNRFASRSGGITQGLVNPPKGRTNVDNFHIKLHNRGKTVAVQPHVAEIWLIQANPCPYALTLTL